MSLARARALARDDARVGAGVLRELSHVQHDAGDLQAALRSAHEGLRLARAVASPGLEALVLHELADVHLGLSAPEEAARYAEQALRAGADHLGPRERAALASSLGGARGKLGREDEALCLKAEALQLARGAGDAPATAAILTSLAAQQRANGDARGALASLEAALATHDRLGPRRNRAATLLELGRTQQALGDVARAAAHFQEAHAQLAARASDVAAWYPSFELARLERGRGRLVRARAWCEAAEDVLEPRRAAAASDSLRLALARQGGLVHALHVDVLMSLHERAPGRRFDHAALAVSERGRARALLATLLAARAAAPAPPSELLERERTLRQRMDTLAPADPELAQLAAEQDHVQGLIRTAGPDGAGAAGATPATVPELRALLDERTALVEYALGKQRSFAWVLTRDGLQAHALPGESVLAPLARELHEALAQRGRTVPDEGAAQRRRRLADMEHRGRRAARDLSELLLRGLPAWTRYPRLVVVPDGALHYVPFAALPLPRHLAAAGAEPTPLLARYEVSHVPSGAVARALRETARARGRAPLEVAVFADPVFDAEDPRLPRRFRRAARRTPASAPRARHAGLLPRLERTTDLARAALADLAPGQGVAALGLDASRERVEATDLSRYRNLIFATHALLDAERPELSGIALSMVDARGAPRDGLLRLYDVHRLKLNAELVVLAGCETGLGRDVRGEGLVGLVHGFLHAGARRVLASLWKVDEEATVELVAAFQDGVRRERLSHAAALRRAQRRLMAQPRRRSPYYWAGFVLQGAWD